MLRNTLGGGVEQAREDLTGAPRRYLRRGAI